MLLALVVDTRTARVQPSSGVPYATLADDGKHRHVTNSNHWTSNYILGRQSRTAIGFLHWRHGISANAAATYEVCALFGSMERALLGRLDLDCTVK